VTYPAHNGKYKGNVLGGGGNPFTGTATDPGSPWNAGVRKVQVRLSYLLSGDTWYWIPGLTAFSSGTVANNGWINTANDSWQYFGVIS
jgi:hypothetical protein